MSGTRNITLGACFLAAAFIAILLPSPLNEMITLVWVSAALLLPFKRVAAMILSTIFLVPTVANLVLVPGIILGLLVLVRLRTRPTIGLFISNACAYLSIAFMSDALSKAFTALSGSLESTHLIVGITFVALFSAYLSSRAQLLFLRLIEARISYAPLH